MKFLTLSNHQLSAVTSRDVRKDAVVTGLPVLDALVPEGFSNGVMHEILVPPGQGKPKYFAMLLAKAVLQGKGNRGGAESVEMRGEDCCLSVPRMSRPCLPLFKNEAHTGKTPVVHEVSPRISADSAPPRLPFLGRVAWCDPRGELWPAALVGNGIPLEQLLILRPRKPADELWAMAECLRCRAIKVTIGALDRLTQVEARRLQLAAERGGGVGILLRPYSAASTTYAAATRWLVRPAPGDDEFQRWKIQLIHGQGGLVGRAILLEANREANLVRASEIVADRPAQTKITTATG